MKPHDMVPRVPQNLPGDSEGTQVGALQQWQSQEPEVCAILLTALAVLSCGCGQGNAK